MSDAGTGEYPDGGGGIPVSCRAGSLDRDASFDGSERSYGNGSGRVGGYRLDESINRDRQRASGVLLHWYVSAGGCDGGGSIVGKESGYPALRTVEGGTKAEVSATVRAWPNPTERYAIQVIAPVPAPSLKADPKTAASKTRVIACGDLEPAGVTPSN